MKEFFASTDMQKLIKKYSEALEDTPPLNDFSNKRKELLIVFFGSLQTRGNDWDEKTQFNIEHIGEQFKSALISVDLSELSLNSMFSNCFRFLLERDMFTEGEGTQFSRRFKNIAIYEYDKFDERTKEQIDYTLREMPITLVKKLVFSENAKSYREFNNNLKEAARMDSEWQGFLHDKQARVDALNDVLTRQESAFNFVGLYAGFAKLGRIKAKELRWARTAMFIFGGLLPIPLIGEAIYLVFTSKPITDLEHLIKSIPIISITLILIYYFRIALGNYNSVRAQMMQIELRKSLCRFIQSYSEYAKELKAENKDLLSKFEDVIFSNVMTSEDKIPSTFDGLEHITGLIGAIRGGKEK